MFKVCLRLLLVFGFSLAAYAGTDPRSFDPLNSVPTASAQPRPTLAYTDTKPISSNKHHKHKKCKRCHLKKKKKK